MGRQVDENADMIRPIRAWPLALVLALAAWPVWAGAQPDGSPAGSSMNLPPDSGDSENAALERTSNRINLRVGAASTDSNGRPTVCMEVRAVSRLSVEGCGTGSGVLHSASGGEMAHFRAKWRLDSRPVRRGLLRTHAGVGFAELQIDADEPGFVVNPRPGSVEAVGPETSLSLQWLRPMGRGWELLVNTSAGVAWIPGAGELAEPQSTVQPFVSFELGVGW
jgi:hypothetical protein